MDNFLFYFFRKQYLKRKKITACIFDLSTNTSFSFRSFIFLLVMFISNGLRRWKHEFCKWHLRNSAFYLEIFFSFSLPNRKKKFGFWKDDKSMKQNKLFSLKICKFYLCKENWNDFVFNLFIFWVSNRKNLKRLPNCFCGSECKKISWYPPTIGSKVFCFFFLLFKGSNKRKTKS